MFKFLKSKKGFTLVELMIVVVIMAILVAVAVPIYSAVTRNARVKTCAGNRREIVSQVNNWQMGSVDGKTHNIDVDFVIHSNGDKGVVVTGANTHADMGISDFTGLFQTVPYCPSGNAVFNDDGTVKTAATQGKYTVTITAVTPATDDTDATATVTVTCSGGESGEVHA